MGLNHRFVEINETINVIPLYVCYMFSLVDRPQSNGVVSSDKFNDFGNTVFVVNCFLVREVLNNT